MQIPVLRFKGKIKLLQGCSRLRVVRMHIRASKFGSTVILLWQKWKHQWFESPSLLQETTNCKCISCGGIIEAGQRNSGSLGRGEIRAYPIRNLHWSVLKQKNDHVILWLKNFKWISIVNKINLDFLAWPVRSATNQA